MDRTSSTATVVIDAVDAPFTALADDDVLDLTDATGPRILRAPRQLRAPRDWRARAALAGVVVILVAVAWHLIGHMIDGSLGTFTIIYTVALSGFVLSRFAFAACYRPAPWAAHAPRVTVVIPAYNEGPTVARTIEACMRLDYPDDSLDIVCVDDGSTDDTALHIRETIARHGERPARQIDLGTNQGKRAAMAAGIRAATDAEIIVFIDSDSHPASDAVLRIVQGFHDPEVGAIVGLTHVRNARTNLLTRMQAVRYFVSFRVLKAAESVVGAVTCCSGCFAAYRRAPVMEHLEAWEHQRFLGVACTYGDDRALTNMLLRRGWRARYADDAAAWTDAPDEYRRFLRQQLRWKKSWVRESPLLLSHLWRSRPLAFPFALVGVLASVLSPFVIGYHLVTAASTDWSTVAVYVVALYLVSMAYALVYRSQRDDGMWWCALAGTVMYLLISPQLLWAMVRVRDGSWGTRG